MATLLVEIPHIAVGLIVDITVLFDWTDAFGSDLQFFIGRIRFINVFNLKLPGWRFKFALELQLDGWDLNEAVRLGM